MKALKVVDLIVRAILILPPLMVESLASVLGSLAYCLYPRERRLAIRNIKACYPQMISAWHRQIALKSFQHIVICAYELLRLAHARHKLAAHLTIENEQHLREALDLGNGVILITAHLGNVGLLTGAFDSLSPQPAYFMRKSTVKNQWLVDKFREYRETYLYNKTSFIPLQTTISGAIAAAHLLKRGNIVLVASDLTWGSGTVPVQFLGLPYSMSRAAASLALRTGAPLVPVFIFRKDHRMHHVVIERPIGSPSGFSKKVQEKVMLEKFSSVLEKYVRLYPEQWFWIHRGSWQLQDRDS